MDELANSLRPQEHHLNYAGRLKIGRSIGSRRIEGACKNLIGRRLKQIVTRWVFRRVNAWTAWAALSTYGRVVASGNILTT